VREPVELSQVSLTVSLAGLLLFGFVAKDYVVIVKKEKDHGSVIVW